ncbi:uncharacterized protein [Miscanthus floridulus]|uniref:uncharacterized protein n=1 Tax=Miscanthus floridulus TaxID=154761 RepID=UPI00345B325F
MSSSIQPTPGTVAWTVGGVDCAIPSDATMAITDPAELVAVVATSVWAIGGTNCAALSNATATASDFARPTSGAVTWATRGTYCTTPSDTTMAASGCSRLGVVMAACSATSEGTGATVGATGPANEAKIGATSGSAIHPSWRASLFLGTDPRGWPHR